MVLASSRPPRWASVLLVVGAVLLAVGLAFAFMNAPSVAPQAVAPTDPESSTARDEAGPTVLIIGDSYTAGSAEGGYGSASWPQVAYGNLRSTVPGLRMHVEAFGGSGYVARGPENSPTFVEAVSTAPDRAYDLVVFLGSRNDPGVREQVRPAAMSAFATAARRWPDARILVVGPPWVNGDPPPGIRENRDAVAAAAASAGAVFVDPLRDGWFAGDFSGLIGSDGVHPTDAGHRRMAELLVPRIEAELRAASTG